MAIEIKMVTNYRIYLPDLDPSVEIIRGDAQDYYKDLDKSRLEIGEDATVIEIKPPTKRMLMRVTQKHGINGLSEEELSGNLPAFTDMLYDIANKCVVSISSEEDLSVVDEDFMVDLGSLIFGKAILTKADLGN